MKSKLATLAVCILFIATVLAAVGPNMSAEPETKTYKIAWLMIIDWNSDYNDATYCIKNHEDKPADWIIETTSIYFDDIQAGECLVSEYDLILTTGHEGYTFTTEQRQILEEYVRSGGILWFDDCANLEIDNMPFDMEIDFGAGTYWGLCYDQGYDVWLPNHPLMDGVYTITNANIRGDSLRESQWFTPLASWDSRYEVVLWGTDMHTPSWFSGPAIVAAQQGYGKIVATAMDISCGLEARTYTPNWDYQVPRFDFRLVYNMLAWSNQPTFKNYYLTWNTPLEGEEYFIDEVVPLEFTTVDENGTPVDDNTSFIEVWKGSTFITDAFSIAFSNGIYTSSWDTTGMTEGNYTILADFEGYCSQEPVNITLKLNQPPVADAGDNQTVNEKETVQFNGNGSFDPEGFPLVAYLWDFDANVDTDGDGNPTNDIDATGPTPTHIYGDDGDGVDGNYVVTLTVIDNFNLTDTDTCIVTVKNVDPTVTIESAVMDVEISIRLAGSKWSNVGLTLYEDNSTIGYLEVERWPGSPDNNPTYANPALPTTLDMTKSYKAVVTYDPYPDSGDEIKGDQPNNGKDKKDNAGNPVWIVLRFEDGNETRIHHTFNTQQSKIRGSDHPNHVDPWEVELNPYLVGHNFTVTSEISDPGSDDELLVYTYGTQTVNKDHLRNPPNPDPYPSPQVNPMNVIDITTFIYEGAGTLTLDVKDDDNVRLSTAGSSQSMSIA